MCFFASVAPPCFDTVSKFGASHWHLTSSAHANRAMPSVLHGNLQFSSSICRGSYYALCIPHSSNALCDFAVRKLFWVSVWRIVPTTQNPFLPGSSHHPNKRCMLVFPKASFSFDAPGPQLSEFGQSMLRAFETEAAEASQLLPGSSPEELQSEDLLHHLSVVPTDFVVCAVSLILGASIGFMSSKFTLEKHSGNFEPFAERLLIMNPTPFNRFVLIRCPSLKCKDVNVYEGKSKMLTAEGHRVVKIGSNESHHVRDNVNTNDIDTSNFKANDGATGHWLQNLLNSASQRKIGMDTNLEQCFFPYQRTFLNTTDGGVLAIDWPSYLEVSGEHGLDTTCLLVPGSVDGSKGAGIQDFVQKCVKHGYFPIVLNPRGCGGSPLTTPRLFTAGDSDDVRTAVEFVLKSRPSATIMAIGWGYGADMLVKYLGEEAASTPVTAAVCIENMFDLEESTKLSEDDHANMFNLMMTRNFVEILKSNQDNASAGKNFCIPYHVFEENPFTTLILRHIENGEHVPLTNASVHSALMIEWLAAVELAFLKGRHPLLHGIEVTFKPPLRERTPAELLPRSTESAEMMAKNANESTRMGRHESSANGLSSVNQRSRDSSPLDMGHSTYQSTAPSNDANALIIHSDNSHEYESADSPKGDPNGIGNESQEISETSDDDGAEVEQGHVRWAAESVLKVLDVTMPGTLSKEKKKEVLEAVGRGETIVSALQEACPEDVREKMVTAASAAVQARGISLKLAGFGEKMPPPNLPAGMVEGVQHKLSSSVHQLPEGPTHDTQKKPMPDPAASCSPPVENGDQCSSSGQNEGAQKVDVETLTTKQGESPTAVTPGNQTENGAATEILGNTGSKPDQSSQNSSPEKEMQGDAPMTDKEAGHMKRKPVGRGNDTKESDSMNKEKHCDSLPQEAGRMEGKPVGHENDTKESDSMNKEKHCDSLPQELPKTQDLDQKQEKSAAESQVNEPKADKCDGVDSSSVEPNRNIPVQNAQETSSAQSTSNNASSSPLSSLNLGLAVEALTGVDDATQMAVTNVFGVMENVVEQLESERGKKDEQLQKNPKDELSESGQMPKHQTSENDKQSSSAVPERSTTGRDMDDPNHSSIHSEPLAGSPGQLDSHEGTGGPECSPGNGYGGAQRYSRKSKNVAAKEFDNQTEGRSFSDLSTASSSSEKGGTCNTTDLALEYFEDENIWKLDTTSSDANRFPGGVSTEAIHKNGPIMNSKIDTIISTEGNGVINPKHNVLDGETEHDKNREASTIETVQNNDDRHLEHSLESLSSTGQPCSYPIPFPSLQTKIELLLVNALELELVRRSGKSDVRILTDNLKHDVEVVSVTVAEAVVKALEDCQMDCSDEEVSEKALIKTATKVHVDAVVRAMNRAYEELVDIPACLPAGVLLGIILAALAPLGIIASHDVQDTENFVQTHSKDSSSMNGSSLVPMSENPRFLEKQNDRGAVTHIGQKVTKIDENLKDDDAVHKEKKMDSTSQKENLLGGSQLDDRKHASTENTTSTENMMGAMAAAVGATSVLAGQENDNGQCSNGGPGSQVLNDGIARSLSEHGDSLLGKDESDATVVSSLAEKAMSVAAPVVPTKEDGGVDHERLVGLLAGLGQKGGILRFVAKAALLWGGLRGAMSLTDRLLGFLRISDRPLHERIAGFMVLVVLIWLPVLVPMIPSLLQQWASGSSNGIFSTGALVGLYCAVVILVNIWGRKIRGYNDPLYHYGIKIRPRSNAGQLRSLLGGLVLGLSLLASVCLLGLAFQFIQLNLAQNMLFINRASNTMLGNVVHSWRIFKVIIQCFAINLAVSFVEELFFRSWLQKEISADLGFHKAALLSGLAFSMTHRSLSLAPGLWFLSLVLTGVKFHCNGDLNLAIGLHAGLMAGTQLINMFGQVKYGPHASIWFIGRQSTDPFSGLIGISLLAFLAVIIYPWRRLSEKEQKSLA